MCGSCFRLLTRESGSAYAALKCRIGDRAVAEVGSLAEGVALDLRRLDWRRRLDLDSIVDEDGLGCFLCLPRESWKLELMRRLILDLVL